MKTNRSTTMTTPRDEIEITAYVDDAGYLCAIDTGEILREATDDEEAESRDAGPTGAIRVTVPRVLIDEEFEMGELDPTECPDKERRKRFADNAADGPWVCSHDAYVPDVVLTRDGGAR